MSTPATVPIPQGATVDAQPQTVPIPAGASIEGEGAAIQPVTTSTNPKLNIAASGEDMPEYVGKVGAVGAGLMAGTALASAAAPATEGVLQFTESQLAHFAEAYPHLAKLAAHLGYGAGVAGAYRVFEKLFK